MLGSVVIQELHGGRVFADLLLLTSYKCVIVGGCIDYQNQVFVLF